MFTEDGTVTLDTLKGGAALQLFQEELDKVVANIMDPNTDAEAVREAVIKVRIKPDKDRSGGAVQIIPSSKLAPAVALGTRMFFGKKGTRFMAFEHNPQQLTFAMERGDVSVVQGGKSSSGE